MSFIKTILTGSFLFVCENMYYAATKRILRYIYWRISTAQGLRYGHSIVLRSYELSVSIKL